LFTLARRGACAHNLTRAPLPAAPPRARADTVLLFTPDALHALLSPQKGARAHTQRCEHGPRAQTN
jgi:hypothetical protein